MKVSFIGGGGTVGSTAAFRTAGQGQIDEIVLIDARDHVARAHAMDLELALADLGRPDAGATEGGDTVVRAGGWDALTASDIVVFSAGVPERSVATRDDYLAGNVAIVREAAGHLARQCPGAVVVVATNPIDVFTGALPRWTGMPARQFVGFSRNDSVRLRWAIARALGVRSVDVGAWVLGEHGELQVPLFDRVTVRGQAVQLTAEQEAAVLADIQSWFSSYQALQSGRTSGWVSGVGLGEMVGALLAAPDEPVPCSAMLSGEYGLSGVSLGVPARLGRDGVREVVELPLTDAQHDRLAAAAAKIKAATDAILAVTP
jgi:malate dehydrogenase